MSSGHLPFKSNNSFILDISLAIIFALTHKKFIIHKLVRRLRRSGGGRGEQLKKEYAADANALLYVF